MARARPLQRLLDGSLQGITDRARMLDRLTAEVRRLLPEVGAHCQVANIRGDELILQVDSPAWATRLRYQGKALVGQLRRRGFPELKTVRVRVAPPARSSPPPYRRARLSPSSGELLRQTAAAVDDDALRAALERLASRAGE